MPFDDNFRRPHAFIALEGVEILTHCSRIGRIYTVERRQIPIVPVKRDLFFGEYFRHIGIPDDIR